MLASSSSAEQVRVDKAREPIQNCTSWTRNKEVCTLVVGRPRYSPGHNKK